MTLLQSQSNFEETLRDMLRRLFNTRLKDFKVHEVLINEEEKGSFYVILVVDEYPSEDVEDEIEEILEFVEDAHGIIMDGRYRFKQ